MFRAALKGRINTAQGSALGSRLTLEQALKGRHNSIPNISFVIINLIPFQKTAKFLLKCFASVMFPLTGDVFSDFRHIGLTDGKCAISALPIKVGV